MFRSKKVEALFSSAHEKYTVYIISEVGINHNGSLETALELIEASKKAGVDAVKFQKRNLHNIYSERILNDPNSAEWSFDYLIPQLKELELSEDDYNVIRDKCQELELDLIVTPFDEESAEFVYSLGIPAIKIASADMTNFPLIDKCAEFNLPLLISTGMWSERDIEKCVSYYNQRGFQYALLHTISTYPASYDSLNLCFIERLKEMSKVVGYSGHERGIFIPLVAIGLGCRIIEKHITFDRNQKGPDHKASLYPDEFIQMVKEIRSVEKAFGRIKNVNQAETLNKEVFAKSAIAKHGMKKGSILEPSDVIFRAPGKGIFPHEIGEFYGKGLTKDIPIGKYISQSDFEEELIIKDWKKFSFRKKWGVKCRFHDFDEYSVLNSPVIEFHCSQTDLNINFTGKSLTSELIVHAPEIFNRELVDICSADKDKVRHSLEILQESIDKTISLSSKFPAVKPKLVVHLGGMSLNPIEKPMSSREMMERATDNFSKLKYSCDLIEILPENLPPRPWYLGGEWHQYGFMHPDDFITFCTFHGLGMTFDLCHAYLYCNYSGDSIAKYIQSVSHLIKHVHISDASGISGEGVQIGEGEINFEEVFRAMEHIDFTWIPEVWSGHLHHGAGIYKALLRLERYNYAL